MNRILKNHAFLSKLCAPNPTPTLKRATLSELGAVIEIFYNRDKIPLTMEERRLLAKHAALLQQIGRIRSPGKAVDVLCASHAIIPLIVRPALELSGLPAS